MDVQGMVVKMQDAATVERVYGEPYEKAGVSVKPVARGGSGDARGGEHASRSVQRCAGRRIAPLRNAPFTNLCG
jgi:hypothetical protein